MAKSRLDQMVEVYAEHKRMFNPATVTPEEKADILDVVKQCCLDDVRDELIRQMKQETKKEAKAYKKSLFKKVRITLIIETIFIALLVGIMVNQVTALIPSDWALPVIIICLVLCTLLILLETGKN